MSAFTDFLVNMLLPTIEQLGESALVNVLQKFHDEQPEQYNAAIIAGHTFIKPLLAYVGGTSGKVDDGFVEAVNEAITLSALANGIVLT